MYEMVDWQLLCTTCGNKVCDCETYEFMDKYCYSEKLDLAAVYPNNTFLISVSGKQGRIYGDMTPVLLFDAT